MLSTQLLELGLRYQYMYISDNNAVIISILFHFHESHSLFIYLMWIFIINLLDNGSLFTFSHGCCVVFTDSLLMLKAL